jgi:hypothetical protein
MNKAWRIVSGIALLCLVIGVVGIGVGFFTGSSPVIIQNHGSLTEYAQRLETNWAIVQQNFSSLLASLGLG